MAPGPAVDRLSDPFGALGADRSHEVQALLAAACLYPAWPEGVPQKVEGDVGVVAFPVSAFAINDLGFLRVQSQATVLKAPL